jgi:L-threonylcarbamoyladenylate synthase
MLRQGAVLAYPTEGVFGVGCDPRFEPGLERVLAIKGRSARMGLILVAASVAQVLEFACAVGGERMSEVLQSWPGPVTWVLPARRGVSPLVTGGRDTVAVRVTAHPVAAALCAAFGRAVVSTSANLSGRPAARSALAARRALGAELDGVVPGRVSGGGPSVIRDAADGRILRG